MAICNDRLFPTMADEMEYYCKASGMEVHRKKLTDCYKEEKLRQNPDWTVMMVDNPLGRAMESNDCSEAILKSIM